MAPSAGRSSIGVRVRPNSHDFIRDLRQQMAAKKFTFYAEVGAKTGQATIDVRKWANEQLPRINANVQVGANTGQATRDMRAWQAKANTKITVAVHANTSPATRQVEAWRTAMSGKDVEIRVKANMRTGGIDSIRRGLERDATVNVRAKTAKAKKDIAAVTDDYGLFTVEVDADTKKAKLKVREVFDEVRGEQLEMDLGIDTTAAVAKAAAVKKGIEKDPVRAQLDLDTKAARLRLIELRIQAQAKKLELDVKIKRTGVDAFGDALKGIERQFGSFSFIRSLNAGPINLGKPTGLIGTLATVTSLAGLLPGAVLGLTSMAKALTDVAGAASIVPGALGGVLASVATVALSTNGVGDAFSSMFDLWNEGATEQQSSAASLASAHDSYRNAVVDEAKAQRDVGRARRDALGDLRSLNNELRGGVLNEAQAILDVQKARERLAKGGFDSGTDRQQAELDLRTSLLRVDEVREQNIKTQQKVNDANVQGVEGSDRVQDALEAQTRAAQATAQAATALTTATTNGTSASSAYADALARLSPNAREFVEAFADSKGEIQGLQKGLQEIFFQDLGPGLKGAFANLLPIVEPGMQRIAKAMNASILQVFDSVSSPDGQSILDRILGGTAQAQEALTKVIDPLVKGVGTLVAAGAEHLPQIVDLVGRLAERFSNFITEADKNGSLDEFMDRGVKALENLTEIGINAIKIINDLGNAFGGDLLQNIVDITNRWHDFLSSTEGQNKLKDYIQRAKDIYEDWRPTLERLPEIFESASQGAQKIIGLLTPFINTFSFFLEKAPGLVEAFIGAWLVSKFVVGVVSPILTMITGIAKLPGLIRAIPALPALPGGMPAIGPGGAPAAPPTVGSVSKGSRILGALGTAGNIALGGAAVVATVGTLGEIGVEASQAQPKAAEIGDINAQLPAGVKPIAGLQRDKATFEAYKMLAEQGNKAAQWLMAAAGPEGISAPGTITPDFFTDPAKEQDFAKRYLWLAQHADQTGENFTPPPSYAVGGYTPWDQKTGKIAVLHGKEYVQPADTTAHYGVAAMQAIHEKKVPREFLQGFAGGGMVPMANPNWDQPAPKYPGVEFPGEEAYWGDDEMPTGVKPPPWGSAPGPQPGGYTIPGFLTPGLPIPGPGAGTFGGGRPGGSGAPGIGNSILPGFETGGYNDPNDPRKKNPQPGIIDSLVQHGEAGLGSVQLPGQIGVQGSGPLPGPIGITGTGPLPGPADVASSPIPATTLQLGPFSVPVGTAAAGSGWGPGGPPIGLGGGDGFDIRSKGIGPGPVGSGPADWQNFAMGQFGKLANGIGSELVGGILSGLGLSGVSSYLSAADPLISNMLKGGSGGNSDVASLLNTADGLAGNPADGSAPGAMSILFGPGGSALPGVAATAAGSGGQGLQTNTARGKAIIQQYFPWATNIGGVRADPLKWHPSGLALDVMIPGAGGNNDPTPPQGKAMGDQLYAWLNAHKSELGIDYMLWQQKDHFNHIHVNFAASGYPDGSTPVGAPSGIAPPASAGGKKGGSWIGPARPGSPAPSSGESGPKMPGPLSDLLAGAGLNAQAADPTKIPALTRDTGGWLPTGSTVVHNHTGSPELVMNRDTMRQFALGGFNAPSGLVLPKPVIPDAKLMAPKPVAPAPPPPVAPKPSIPTPLPSAPPPMATAPAGPQAAPGATTEGGPGGAAIDLTPRGGGPGPGASSSGDHLNPAVSKGITSGFAAAGNVAAAAASAFGGGGGAAGGLISGLFGQAGKIATNVANVGASFLVGNITGGTTANPYGVTQRGSIPSGGTKVVDASSTHNGDIVTNDLDSYFRRKQRQEAVDAQSGLGRWGAA